jgi:hypothetical protein
MTGIQMILPEAEKPGGHACCRISHGTSPATIGLISHIKLYKNKKYFIFKVI